MSRRLAAGDADDPPVGDGESYSVPMVLELEGRGGREISQAAVYIALYRLEEKGLDAVAEEG